MGVFGMMRDRLRALWRALWGAIISGGTPRTRLAILSAAALLALLLVSVALALNTSGATTQAPMALVSAPTTTSTISAHRHDHTAQPDRHHPQEHVKAQDTASTPTAATATAFVAPSRANRHARRRRHLLPVLRHPHSHAAHAQPDRYQRAHRDSYSDGDGDGGSDGNGNRRPAAPARPGDLHPLPLLRGE